MRSPFPIQRLPYPKASMSTLRSHASRAIAGAILTATAVAQIPPVPTPLIRRQGPFSSWPIGIVERDQGTGTILQVEPAPRSGSPVAPVVHPDRPNWTIASLFPHLTPMLQFKIGFSAIDSGNAILPGTWQQFTSDSGTVGIKPDLLFDNRWLALSASFTDTSPLIGHPLLTAGQGSHLISYFFLNSPDIPTELPGSLHIEQTEAQIGLSSSSDIQGFDFALGMLMSNPEDDLPLYAPHDDVLYFSVTRQFVSDWTQYGQGQTQAFAATKQDPMMLSEPPDAGVVYRSTWNENTSSWSPPLEFRSLAELGLLAGENIDGLTVDDSREIVIFSTDRQGPVRRQQVLMHDIDLMPAPLGHLPLYDVDDTPIEIKLGVGEEDDIDGLCGIDPEATGSDAGVAVGTPRPGRFAAFYGTQPEYNGLEQPVGFSIARHAPNPTNGYDLTLQVTGWGPYEQPVPCDVTLSMRIETEDQGTRTWSTWASLPPIARGPNEQTLEYVWTVQLPPAQDVTRVEFDAYLTCSDATQYINWANGLIVPSTHPTATPILGASWGADIRF